MKKVIDKVFLLLTQILSKYGFTESVSLRENQCFRFFRITEKKKDKIGIAYFIEGHSILYNGLHSNIAFTDVVEVLNFIEPNPGLTDIIWDHPKIDKVRSVDNKLVNTVIVENNKLLEPEFEQLLTALEEYICRYILPFFDRVSSLQVVNDEIIDVVAHMELHKYISGNLILKKLIIMKLCNNPKYDDFVQWMDVRCQESLLLINDPMHYRYVETYEQFKKLVSYLASGAYLDLVKE